MDVFDVRQKICFPGRAPGARLTKYEQKGKGKKGMKLKERIEQLGATGYILLWLLGVPIPILLLFFLLRGCT